MHMDEMIHQQITEMKGHTALEHTVVEELILLPHVIYAMVIKL